MENLLTKPTSFPVAHGKPKDSDNFKFLVKVDNSTGFREGSIMRSTSISDLYDKDFLVWVEATTQLLKQGKLSKLDIKNLIEEVEDLGKRQKQDLKSRLRVLLMHLLKWQYQPDRRSYPEFSNEWNQNSWARTISTQRDDIQDLLADSPSLYNYLSEVLSESYKKACENASKETNIDLTTFPELCPYTDAQILNKDFWPD
jgi:hypothetical protein